MSLLHVIKYGNISVTEYELILPLDLTFYIMDRFIEKIRIKNPSFEFDYKTQNNQVGLTITADRLDNAFEKYVIQASQSNGTNLSENYINELIKEFLYEYDDTSCD